jgi:uncharacterized protein (DUF2147 family)
MSFVALSALYSVAFAKMPAGASIEGLWRNPAGTAVIAIGPCKEDYCGKVAWASERGQREAKTGTSNVVGSTVLTGLRRSGASWTGRLFIPDDNIHVAAQLQLLNDRNLKLTGCVLAGLLCRSQVWTRVQALPTAGKT